MKQTPTVPDSLSVLIVDEDPDILAFFARMLDSNGMRALLARTPTEAISIANRGYVPINVLVTDVTLHSGRTALNGSDSGAPEATINSGRELFAALREMRPDIRPLFMSAHMDAGIIRIELMDQEFSTDSTRPNDTGLIEAIRRAATDPMVRRAGGSSIG